MRTLNLLLVEDSEDDADLILLELRRGGYHIDHVRVDGAEGMRAALAERKWDLIISDFVMPQFSAPAAIQLLHETGHDIPIIIVSGHIGEDMAVSAMKSGANEYVMKDRLARLAPAVERELREAETRRARKAADEARRESEQRLKIALEAGRLGAWERNLRTGVLSWSSITQDIYGLAPAEFGGTFAEFERLIHPEDRGRVVNQIERCIREHAPYQVEFRIIRAAGEVAWLESRGLLFSSPDGQPERFAGVTVDVTDRKRVELYQKFLVEFSDQIRPLANPAEVLRVAVSAAGRFLRVSRCFGAEIMTEAEEIVVFPNYCDGTESLDGIYSLAAVRWPLLDSLVRGETLVVQDTKRDPRTAAWHELFFAPRGIRAFATVPCLEEGALVWTMAMTAGPEPRAWTQDEVELLRTLTERTWMAQKNARLYEAAQLARDEAEAASRAKDQFLAVLSHELRTPLTPVLLAVHTLQTDPEVPDRFQRALKMIERNIQLEARLIDDLLDLSRITHNKVELQLADIDLHAVVENAVEVCRADIEARRQKLVVELDARQHFVRGDAARLQQVFWNLLKNAAKFTPEGGRITLQSHHRKGTVCVDLQDNGIGIEQQLLPRIFFPFEQGGGRSFSAQYGGLGLGLAISKATVDAHGGHLTAQSAGKNSGAIFTVELPTIHQPNGHP